MNFEWNISTSVSNNIFTLKHSLMSWLAIGIPLVGGIIFFSFWLNIFEVIIFALIIASLPIFLFVYTTSYNYRFVLNEKGVLSKCQDPNAGVQNKLFFIVDAVSLISGSSATGAYVNENTENFIAWELVRKVNYFDEQETILISCSFAENIALFCSPENYSEIKAAMEKRFPQNNEKWPEYKGGEVI